MAKTKSTAKKTIGKPSAAIKAPSPTRIARLERQVATRITTEGTRRDYLALPVTERRRRLRDVLAEVDAEDRQRERVRERETEKALVRSEWEFEGARREKLEAERELIESYVGLQLATGGEDAIRCGHGALELRDEIDNALANASTAKMVDGLERATRWAVAEFIKPLFERRRKRAEVERVVRLTPTLERILAVEEEDLELAIRRELDRASALSKDGRHGSDEGPTPRAWAVLADVFNVSAKTIQRGAPAESAAPFHLWRLDEMLALEQDESPLAVLEASIARENKP